MYLRGAGGGGWTPEFLLRDDFTTDDAAPLASPRTAEPGPGTTEASQGADSQSISSARLQIASAEPTVRLSSENAYTRAAGLATVLSVRPGNGTSAHVGVVSAKTGDITDGVVFKSGTTLTIMPDEQTAGAYTSGTDYYVAVVMRGTGCLVFIKGGTFTDWTLLTVVASGTYNPYGRLGGLNHAYSADFMRVLQLPAPFDDDYGLATQRLSGSQSAGQTFTHEANCVIEWTQTVRPAPSSTLVKFRMQDASNYWVVDIDQNANFRLHEVVNGSTTTRGHAAGVMSSGHRCVVVADGTTIRGYSNNVLRWTYSSASNFQSATNGELSQLGTNGVVSDIITWPRTLPTAAAEMLDLAVA